MIEGKKMQSCHRNLLANWGLSEFHSSPHWLNFVFYCYHSLVLIAFSKFANYDIRYNFGMLYFNLVYFFLATYTTGMPYHKCYTCLLSSIWKFKFQVLIMLCKCRGSICYDMWCITCAFKFIDFPCSFPTLFVSKGIEIVEIIDKYRNNVE